MFGVVISVSFAGSPTRPPPVRDPSEGGLRSRSVWRGVKETSDFRLLLGFDSNRAAEDDLRKIVESDIVISKEDNLPSEVHTIKIVQQHGYVLDQVPENGFLAVTKAVANPGYGGLSRERMEEAAGTFTQLEGYCGHLIGYNENVEEEVWGFAFGTSIQDVPMSYNDEDVTKLYRRIK